MSAILEGYPAERGGVVCWTFAKSWDAPLTVTPGLIIELDLKLNIDLGPQRHVIPIQVRHTISNEDLPPGTRIFDFKTARITACGTLWRMGMTLLDVSAPLTERPINCLVCRDMLEELSTVSAGKYYLL